MTQAKKTKKTWKANRGKTDDGLPNPIDVHIGSRIKLRRTLLGMSQDNLGNLMGLTFQQIQKYENGKNRVSGSRLWDMSRVLKTNVGFFFEEMDEDVIKNSPRTLSSANENTKHLELAEDGANYDDDDPMTKRKTIEIVRAYYSIEDPKIAKNLYDLILAIANNYRGKIRL